VKYANMSVGFINAIKEQQLQIEAQERRLHQQQQQIEELRRLVCHSNLLVYAGRKSSSTKTEKIA